MAAHRLGLLCFLALGCVEAYITRPPFNGEATRRGGCRTRPLGASSIVDALTTRFQRKKPQETRSEEEQMAEYLEGKPCRAPKVKQLKYIYRPWKDSYLERFRDEEDNAVCLYSLPGGNGLLGGWERTRAEDLWSWPWLWSKAKVRVCGGREQRWPGQR